MFTKLLKDGNFVFTTFFYDDGKFILFGDKTQTFLKFFNLQINHKKINFWSEIWKKNLMDQQEIKSRLKHSLIFHIASRLDNCAPYETK